MAWTPAQATTSGGVSPRNWYYAGAGAFSDAGTTPAVNNDGVYQWSDQASGADNLSQATSGKRPTYLTNILDGHPVLRFDGSADFLQAATASDWTILHDGSALTIFVVWKTRQDNADKHDILLDTLGNTSSAHGFLMMGDNRTVVPVVHTLRVFVGKNVGGSPALNLISPNNSCMGGWWHVSCYRKATTPTGILFLDGRLGAGTATTAIDTPSSTAPSEALSVGALITEAAFLDGDIAEIIIYTATLSEADRLEVSSYLALKYPSAVFGDVYGTTVSDTTLLNDSANNAFPSYAISGNGTKVAVWASGATHAGVDKSIKMKRNTGGGWDAGATTLYTNDATHSYNGLHLCLISTGIIAGALRRDKDDASAIDAMFTYSSDHGANWQSAVDLNVSFTSGKVAGPPVDLPSLSKIGIPVYGIDSGGDTQISLDLYTASYSDLSTWSLAGRIGDGQADGQDYTECGLWISGSTLYAVIRVIDGSELGVYKASAALSDLTTWSAKTAAASYFGGMPSVLMWRTKPVWIARSLGETPQRARFAVSGDNGARWQFGGVTANASPAEYMVYGQFAKYNGYLSGVYANQEADDNADVYAMGEGAQGESAPELPFIQNLLAVPPRRPPTHSPSHVTAIMFPDQPVTQKMDYNVYQKVHPAPVCLPTLAVAGVAVDTYQSSLPSGSQSPSTLHQTTCHTSSRVVA